MAVKGFRYEFTIHELWYKLFKKKICPKCGGKLIQYKTSEMRKGKDAEPRRNGAFFSENADVKCYMYYYDCSKCQHRYSLAELAASK